MSGSISERSLLPCQQPLDKVPSFNVGSKLREKLSKEDSCPSGGQCPLHSRHLCTHSRTRAHTPACTGHSLPHTLSAHTHRAPTAHTCWCLGVGSRETAGAHTGLQTTHSLSFCLCFSYGNLVSLKDLINPWKICFCLLPPT